MTVCPICEGNGRTRYSDDVKVCQNCGGFGFIKKEAETLNQKDKPILATVSGGQQGREDPLRIR